MMTNQSQSSGPLQKSRGQLSASFRDPSGFLFSREGVLYRQVNRKYEQEYLRLMESGLYEKLIKAGLLIPHVESDQLPAEPDFAYKIIQPERVPFISYPYEWSFGQLKDAALATLSIQRRALKQGLLLKDASAYNIQFVRGKATLIDTLSFELYREGQPWVAYRQFCQHFLAPLALMALRDIRLNQLMRVYIDGVPLDLASGLLPAGTRFNFGLLTHIHLHAGAQKRYSGVEVKSRPMGEKGDAFEVDLCINVAAKRGEAVMFSANLVYAGLFQFMHVRPDDIEPLVQHFAASLGEEMGRRIERIAPDALEALRRYRWPGNVRELRNVVERSAYLSPDGVIDLIATGRRTSGPGEPVEFDPTLTFREQKERAIELFEETYLQWLLQRAEGNISRAAREADMDRKYLHKLLRKYGITAQGGDDDEN